MLLFRTPNLYAYSTGKIVNSLALFLVALIALMLTDTAFARNYEVELIIFERNVDSTSSTENIDNSLAARQQKEQHIRSVATKAVQYNINQGVRKLGTVQQQLTSSGYRILRSSHWVQPGNVYQNAPVISLGVNNSALPSAFIRIYKTSLIFADLNLKLTPLQQLSTTSAIDLASEQNQQSTSFVTPEITPAQTDFYISEKRRLKFKEIHYFDHPRFGAILGIWPAN